MTAMTPGSPGTGGRDGGRDDQDDRDDHDGLNDEFVSYWSGDRFVVQNGRGELVATSDTVEEVDR